MPCGAVRLQMVRRGCRHATGAVAAVRPAGTRRVEAGHPSPKRTARTGRRLTPLPRGGGCPATGWGTLPQPDPPEAARLISTRKRACGARAVSGLRPTRLSVRLFAILRRRIAKGISIGAPFHHFLRHYAIDFAIYAQMPRRIAQDTLFAKSVGQWHGELINIWCPPGLELSRAPPLNLPVQELTTLQCDLLCWKARLRQFRRHGPSKGVMGLHLWISGKS